MRRSLIFLLLALSLSGATLSERIEAVAKSSPVALEGFWGAVVTDLDSGGVLYQHNPRKLFVPASNAKLFSTALALMRLGPDHRFRTLVVAGAEPDDAGVITGELRLVGGGDPTLSARKIPYERGPIRGNQLAAIEELADQLAAKGIRRINGGIVGDDSRYVHQPYPEGWAQEDATFEYGAPVSALTLHDNAFRLSVIAGAAAGDPGRVILRPPGEYYLIHNHVTTDPSREASIWVEWPLGSREIHVWGQVKAKAGRAKLLAVRDPAHYGAWALAQALRKRGVEIRGGIRAKHLWMHEVPSLIEAPAGAPLQGAVLAERTSPPLFEILKVVNKASQNLHAELVLREVGRVRRNAGSREAGLAELAEFLAEAGVPKEEAHLEDASGLSRVNLVSPGATVKLLSHMYLSTERDGWLDLLAVGGEDGTLHYRFKAPAARGKVLAKTGTLTGASALSGYVTTATGRNLAFSVMANNYAARSASARKFIDAIVTAMLAE